MWIRVLAKNVGSIERIVRQCDSCALHQKLLTKVSLDPWPVPSRPIKRAYGLCRSDRRTISTHIGGRLLQILRRGNTSTISAARTVDLYHEFFSRYGSSKVLVTDHGMHLRTVRCFLQGNVDLSPPGSGKPFAIEWAGWEDGRHCQKGHR